MTLLRFDHHTDRAFVEKQSEDLKLTYSGKVASAGIDLVLAMFVCPGRVAGKALSLGNMVKLTTV